ncbi:MAG: hypothetical protein ACRDXX_09185 [Stackebrandtia sp.]
MAEPAVSLHEPGALVRRGPGRLLIAVYALFALAACARASWQIAFDFQAAPAAYLLSALAGAIYLMAAVGLSRVGRLSHRFAAICCATELAGVLVVGTLSLAIPQHFPDDTVWSRFGSGYGFVPLLLPVAGLAWLRHVYRRDRGGQSL